MLDPEQTAMRVVDLEATVARLEQTLGTLITWMVQSANSPIRPDEAEALLQMMRAPKTKRP